MGNLLNSPSGSLGVATLTEAHFPNQVYETVIPRNVRLAEAPSYGMPVIAYDKNSRGAKAYLSLADEILNRISIANKVVLRPEKTVQEEVSIN